MKVVILAGGLGTRISEVVSYTHLDVYKRQTLMSKAAVSYYPSYICLLYTSKQGFLEFPLYPAAYPDHRNHCPVKLLPVSYTHLDVYKRQYAGAASLIDQGKIKVLAICSDERSENLPDVPTLKESGIDFTYGSYRGIGVPAGTPDEIVQYLSDTMESVMNSDEVKDQFANRGLRCV